MKIQANANAQLSSANGGAAGNQGPQSGSAFGDALSGVDGASAGGRAGATAAETTGGQPPPASMSPAALTAARLAELATAAANANGVSGTAQPLASAAIGSTAAVKGASPAMSSPPTDANTKATVTPFGLLAPPTSGESGDAGGATESAATAGKIRADAAANGQSTDKPDPKAGLNADTSAAGITAPGMTAAGGVAGASPSADLLAFLSAAVTRGSATGSASSAPASAAATPSTSSHMSLRPAPSGANATAAGGTLDSDVSGSNMLLSEVAIESHIAPAATKSLGAALDGKPGASSVAPAPLITDAGALTPMRAIANSVLSLASQAAGTSAAVAVPDDVTASVPTAARTMTLQLSPASLGTVSVRLHVTGQTLDVELSLSNQQTLGLVSRERDVLASALRDQNYDLHSLVIQGADASRSASGDQYSPNPGTGGGGTDSSGGRSAAGSGDGTGQQASSGSNRQSSRPSGRDDAGTADRAPQRGVDSLFV